ncbi:MAG TPA: ABC transporter permease [Streptosporangiaceae bacterium]
MSVRALRPRTAPPAAFARLTLNEARLAWRNPRALAMGLGLPVLMLVIFGELPYFQRHPAGYRGLTGFDVKVPTLAAMVIAGHAVMGLSLSLAAYREYGILRRMSTTPVPRAWVLAAPAVLQFCLVTAELVILFALAVAAFGLATPQDPGALVLSLFLCVAALFAIGLSIAAVARSSTLPVFAAGVYFPLLFFSGLWIPIAQMPDVLQHIATYTPVGAAVQAIQDSMQGTFPAARALAVMAAWALVFAPVSRRFFRWE